MKITKQTVYRKKTAQRALIMDETLMLIKDEVTGEKIDAFREKLQRAYPRQRYTFIQKSEKRYLMPTGQIAHFGCFLMKTGMSLRKTSCERLYLVVEK